MKAKTKIGTIEDYVKANRKASREEELERNGGRWVAAIEWWPQVFNATPLCRPVQSSKSKKAPDARSTGGL